MEDALEEASPGVGRMEDADGGDGDGLGRVEVDLGVRGQGCI